ncbi:GSCFA domain-containing protein [Lutimonas saemankumensis]|uniref:GSCFA domain-containing protein n=1 Tax=Lutimonas saemankumensis TaxID=483016 RepID=UPI001CD43C5B|nr:GSCFA domain-containing protein [Lutimonas saemankumensis]MCA0932418.1 GSCFA domain-containing protein [Lutimonas saemankumensis]
MKFRTEIDIPEGSVQIDHQSEIVLIGSCFSEEISAKFDYYKFRNFTNPFGILFNPVSIKNAVQYCVPGTAFERKDLHFHQNKWMSLYHHGSFDHADPDLVLGRINKNILDGQKAIQKATHIIITLGTSWVYRFHSDKRIVGNCHKIPQKEFTKELLSSEDILITLKTIITLIREVNHGCTFIFTVSPVRHIKDGFIENTLSKALLHKAIHELKKEEEICYFPSYEIMMDDLRDYRFYKQDLVHPNEMAVDYIWDLFKRSWINDSSINDMTEIEKVQKSLAHKPFDPDSEPHKKFLKNLEGRIRDLKKRIPGVEFDEHFETSN